jgi:hypothetical protein
MEITMQVSIQNTSLVRDMGSRALIETDLSKANDYRIKSKIINDTNMLKQQMVELHKKVEELETVKIDIQEIKQLIKGLCH